MLGGGFKCVLLYTPFGQDCHHGKLTPKQQNLEDQEKIFSTKMKQIRGIGLLTRNNQSIHTCIYHHLPYAVFVLGAAQRARGLVKM